MFGLLGNNIILGGLYVPPVTVNTYIGNVASTLGTASLLATRLAISVSRITDFSIVGTDIKCAISGSYSIPSSAFANDTTMTYYRDYGACTEVLGNAFVNCVVKILYFPVALSVGDGAFGYSVADVVYIPLCINIGSSNTTAGSVFFSSNSKLYIYVHPSMATINGGGVEADLAQAISYGCHVSYVSNTTVPNPITVLTSGTVYNSAIQLNFTNPVLGVNPIDFYEVYVNGLYYSRITSSGGYFDKLTSNTNYNITVVAVDSFYNKSVDSSVLNISTANTPLDAYKIVSFYKLNETSGSVANDSCGTEHLTNSGITINQAGKIGTSYLATAIGQKLETSSATSIGGKFSINTWVYRTASPNALGGLIQQGDYSTNNGFGLWFWASGNLSWRINQTFSSDSSTFAIPLNTWTMVTMVYNQVNVKIYINSVLKVTTGHTVNPNSSNKRTLFYNLNNNAEFFGRQDLACIYKDEITQIDINKHYNSGSGLDF